MTGFPAPVLRGLISDDGEAVIEACTHFFAPDRGGFAVRGDIREWRKYALVLTRATGEPLSRVLEMPWDEALIWLAESQEIEAEDGGGRIVELLAGLLDAMG